MEGYHNGNQGVQPSSERPQHLTRRPSLLPAFEPLSSSPPGLPRVMKRKFEDEEDDHGHEAVDEKDRKYYPTPVPTSSTGMLPSSPDMLSRVTRPQLQRTVSTLSERAPLGALPSLVLSASGDPILMGRSSNSSDYQLSANRLISRVHVRAAYHAPEGSRLQGEVVVECLGWNGAKIHYRGSVVDLAKGESFVSQKPGTQIMVDVQETRIMLAWPKDITEEANTWPWTGSSPSRDDSVEPVSRMASSPPPVLPRLQSPVSPSPNNNASVEDNFETTFIADDLAGSDSPVQVYEDDDSADEPAGMRTPVPVSRGSPEESTVSTPSKTPKPLGFGKPTESEELSEHDEENDPIVHSFGPFGENLLSRFESFQSTSPDHRRDPLRSSFNTNTSPRLMASDFPTIRRKTASPVKSLFDTSPVKNHVINQLAFSRVHSIPLSTIYNNLPSNMKGGRKLDGSNDHTDELKAVLDKMPCIGEIRRQGNDAAGKLLEDEFYYVPEMDSDEHRRAAVGIAKPPLRATRKQHKVSISVCIYTLHSLTRHSNITGRNHATERSSKLRECVYEIPRVLLHGCKAFGERQSTRLSYIPKYGCLLASFSFTSIKPGKHGV